MTLEIWLLSGGILLSMLLTAFFTGAESGIMLSDPLRLQYRAERGEARARLLLNLKEKPDFVIGTVLVGNNIVTVTAAVLTNRLLSLWLEPYLANLITTFGLTLLMLAIFEILPKLIFQHKPEERSLAIVRWIRAAGFVLRPILILVNGISSVLLMLFGLTKKERPGLTREEIGLLAEAGMKQGAINEQSYALFSSVLSIAETTAREIMTPLVDVVALPEDASVEDLVRLIAKSGFSRIPVYRKQAHTMTGYVAAHDLKESRRAGTIGEYIRPAVFIPETKYIDGLLIEIRQSRLPLVFVVDEWGGTAGIITHEDIAEHIVGQILDKGEKTELELQEVSNGEYLADGWMDVDKVQQVLGIIIEKKGFETLGGFLEDLMQRVPAVGESLDHQGYRFLIEEADETRLIRVRIKRLDTRKRKTSSAKKTK